jgi:hypothetical protein
VWLCDFGPKQFGWLLNQLGEPLIYDQHAHYGLDEFEVIFKHYAVDSVVCGKKIPAMVNQSHCKVE